ncbi:MAG TPA: hypothetical protein VFZ26_02645, partial [Gemmatimonadales bacterium]
YTDQPKEDFRTATGYVVAHAEPGDGIVFHSAGTRAPFEYYLAALGAEAGAPHALRPPEPWGMLDLLSPHETRALDDWLTRWRGDRPRVWLVLKYPVALPNGFEREYCRLRARSFSGVHVLLYRKRPRAGEECR